MSSNAERPAKSDTPPNKEADPLPSATTEEKRSRRFELVPIDEIKPNSHYVRKPGRGQRSKLKASYRKFGENSPLLVDRNLVILAGVQRWEALKELGRSHVWVVVLDHLSDAQARGYALADNKIGEHSDWDPAKLGAELKELDAISVDFEMSDLGFEPGEIDFYIQALDDDAFDRHDEFSQPDGPAITKIGDLWTLGTHRLLCGDSLAASSHERLMQGSVASVIFSDPPYNLEIDGFVSGNGVRKHREFPQASGEMTPPEFTEFLAGVFRFMGEHSTAGALIYVFMDFRHMREILSAADASELPLVNLCVWTKSNAGMGGLYRSQHELCFVFKNGTAAHINNVQLGKFGRNRSNIWRYPGTNSFPRRGEKDPLAYHPTAKPIRMVADAILDSTRRGDIVLDPFIGAGSTILAAEHTARQCFGIELDPLHIDTTIRRWERMTGQQAVDPSGQTFAEVSRLRSVGHDR